VAINLKFKTLFTIRNKFNVEKNSKLPFSLVHTLLLCVEMKTT